MKFYFIYRNFLQLKDVFLILYEVIRSIRGPRYTVPHLFPPVRKDYNEKSPINQ